MGGRKLRLSTRKNEERKKYSVESLIVSVVLTKNILALPVSIPRHLIERPVLAVSIPLTAFTDSRACSLKRLQSRLQVTKLPPTWVDVSHEDSLHPLTLCQVKPTLPRADVTFTLSITDEFEWTLTFHDHFLDGHKCEVLGGTPQALDSVSKVCQLLWALNSSKVCMGNDDKKFLEVMDHRAKTLQSDGKFATWIYYST